MIANNLFPSWLRYSRPAEGRKEEAGSRQGEKDARLGEAIVHQRVCLCGSAEGLSRETACTKVLLARGRIRKTELLAKAALPASNHLQPMYRIVTIGSESRRRILETFLYNIVYILTV